MNVRKQTAGEPGYLKKKEEEEEESSLNWKKILSVIMYSTGKGFLQAKGQIEFGSKRFHKFFNNDCALSVNNNQRLQVA